MENVYDLVKRIGNNLGMTNLDDEAIKGLILSLVKTGNEKKLIEDWSTLENVLIDIKDVTLLRRLLPSALATDKKAIEDMVLKYGNEEEIDSCFSMYELDRDKLIENVLQSNDAERVYNALLKFRTKLSPEMMKTLENHLYSIGNAEWIVEYASRFPNADKAKAWEKIKEINEPFWYMDFGNEVEEYKLDAEEALWNMNAGQYLMRFYEKNRVYNKPIYPKGFDKKLIEMKDPYCIINYIFSKDDVDVNKMIEALVDIGDNYSFIELLAHQDSYNTYGKRVNFHYLKKNLKDVDLFDVYFKYYHKHLSKYMDIGEGIRRNFEQVKMIAKLFNTPYLKYLLYETFKDYDSFDKPSMDDVKAKFAATLGKYDKKDRYTSDVIERYFLEENQGFKDVKELIKK